KSDQSELVIDRVRELLGRPLPQDLIDLYRERIARIGHFGAIAPSWNDWVGWSKDVVSPTALLHAEAVPIFSDGCFNLFGLDLSSGAETPAVYFFEESRGFERPVYAAGSSLSAFLLLLAEEDLAFQEKRPPGWQLAIDPDLDKCPRAPPIWRAL
ncbi:MAG: SMI1/KNR4 family protein, partial [Caulobacteraceae bacterium]